MHPIEVYISMTSENSSSFLALNIGGCVTVVTHYLFHLDLFESSVSAWITNYLLIFLFVNVA